MAYFLNEEERKELQSELVKMNFNRAKGKLRRMDRKAKLGTYRNVQNIGEWMTTYDLPSLGAHVTLIENCSLGTDDPNERVKARYDMVRVIVEPTTGNRT
ncbi:MAG: hypothetical protein SH821_05955 [Phototrophicales bacterium]|jgi:hypothetical protein|nr:hypothetical protein [Phototrophicales bacterium]